MRTLTTDQETARAADGHRVSRFLSIAWDSGTEYYSERATAEIDPDSGKTFLPLLSTFPEIRRTVNLSIEKADPLQTVQFAMIVDQSAATPINEQADLENPIGLEIVFYQVFYTGSALSDTDWSTLGKYRITSVGEDSANGALVLRIGCEDYFQTVGEEVVGRLITAKLISGAKHSFGDMIPMIFGEIKEAPLLLVTSGERATLSGRHSFDDAILYLASDVLASVFTAPGSVIVDVEKISFTGIDVGANTLTGLTRGASNTTQTEHANGAEVIEELDHYDFLAMDGAAAWLDTVVVNGQTIPSVDPGGGLPYYSTAAVLLAEGDSLYVQVMTLYGLPTVVTTGTTTSLIRLGQAASPIVMADDGSSGNVTNPGDAVDYTEDDAHVTYAGLTANSNFKVAQTNDLSDENSEIKRAFAVVEYQVDLAGGSWPTTPPTVRVLAGAVEAASATLAQPTDVDGTLAPDTDPTDDSTALFVLSEGVNLSTRTVEMRFHSFTGSTTERFRASFAPPPGEAIAYYWPDVDTLSSGDVVNYGSGLLSESSSGYTASNIAFATMHPANLNLRVFDDGLLDDDMAIATIVAHVEVKGSGSLGKARATLTIGGSSDSETTSTLTANEARTIVLSVSGSFTKDQLLAATVSIDAPNEDIPYLTPSLGEHDGYVKFTLLGVALYIQESRTFVGETTPLDSMIPSSRVRQRVDITTPVLAAGGWPWFDGTGADAPMIQIQYPENVGNETEIRVYNADFEVDVLDTIAEPITEDTVEATARVVGITGATAGTNGSIQSYEAIYKILTGTYDPYTPVASTGFSFYGLTSAAIENTSFAAAIKDATQNYANSWTFHRRIIQPIKLRDLLYSAIFDAGIRASIDGGQIVFAPRLSADFEATDRALTRDNMLAPFPTKQRTHLSLVANQVAIYYGRRVDGDLGFKNLYEGNDYVSQAKNWGVHRVTPNLEWLIENVVVATGKGNVEIISDNILADNATTRTLVTFGLPAGPHIDLMLFDVVTLTDSYANLSGAVGRILGLSFPSPDRLSVVVGISDTKTRIWEDVASSSYIDVYPGWNRGRIAIDGSIVGQWDNTGFKIAGNLVISGTNLGAAATDLIEYDTNAIYFAVNTGGDHENKSLETAAILTSAGRLQVANLVTSDTYPTDFAVQPWTDPDTTWENSGYFEVDTDTDGTENDTIFNTDLRRAMMRLRESDRALITRGIWNNAI